MGHEGDAEPVFLQFTLRNNNRFDDDEEYVVPEGKKLRVEFVGVSMSGTSIGSGELHNSVALVATFMDGEGGTCNHPSEDGECSIRIPVIPLNNSKVGANVSFGFPSTAGPVSLEVPAGGKVTSRLSSAFGAPDRDTLRFIHVTAAGQLIDTP